MYVHTYTHTHIYICGKIKVSGGSTDTVCANMHIYTHAYIRVQLFFFGREDRYLEAALERMQVDGQNVEVLLAAQKRNAANPATKVDADEQEAMAIENLAKLG